MQDYNKRKYNSSMIWETFWGWPHYSMSKNMPLKPPVTAPDNFFGLVNNVPMESGLVLTRAFSTRNGYNIKIRYTSGPNIIKIRTTTRRPPSTDLSSNTTNETVSTCNVVDGTSPQEQRAQSPSTSSLQSTLLTPSQKEEITQALSLLERMANSITMCSTLIDSKPNQWES